MSEKLDNAVEELYDLIVETDKGVIKKCLVEDVFNDFCEAINELYEAAEEDNLTPETNLEHYSDILLDMIQNDASIFSEDYNFIDINVENLIRKLDITDSLYTPSANLLKWLVSPYGDNSAVKEVKILDNTEKNYLSAVIKPFVNSECNVKLRKVENGLGMYLIEIRICLDNAYIHTITLPPFDEDEEMYIVMSLDRWYKTKELELE